MDRFRSTVGDMHRSDVAVVCPAEVNLIEVDLVVYGAVLVHWQPP
jgi:hypothetical protein